MWELRLSFSGSRLLSRIFPTMAEAAAESEFLQRDYCGRGWVVVDDEGGITH